MRLKRGENEGARPINFNVYLASGRSGLNTRSTWRFSGLDGNQASRKVGWRVLRSG